MRLIALDELTPGMRVARTLRYDFGGVMLHAGFAMDHVTIGKLRQFNVKVLYVHDEDTEDVDINDYIDERTRREVSERIQNLFTHMKSEVARLFKPTDLKSLSLEEFKHRLRKGRFRKILDETNLRATMFRYVELIVQNLLSDREICMCVGTIKSSNTYIYDHSLEVAIHSAMIARRLGFTVREIKEVVLGCLLHDIGYIFIPDDITQKQGKLTEKEQDLMKMHTVYGYYLLRDRDDIPLLASHIAYQHHEQQDGQGYPRGLLGTNRVLNKREAIKMEVDIEGSGMIHRYSNIVAVPNLYDSLISPLPYRKPVPPDEAVEVLKQSAGTVLNKQIVDEFLSYLPVYPLGTKVVFVKGRYSGYTGIVVKVEPQRLDKPVVRILYDRKKKLSKPIDIDLSEDSFKIKALLNA